MSSPEPKRNWRIVDLAARPSIVAILLLVFYLSVLLALTMAPHPRPPLHLVNVIPFKSILAGLRRGGWLLNVNVLGNMVAFVPLGMLVPAISRRLNMASVVWVSLLISAAIETLQWLFARRVADIDDVILNIVGAIVGYGCYLLLADQAPISPEDSAQQ